MAETPALFRRPAPPRVAAEPVVAWGLVPEPVDGALAACRARLPVLPGLLVTPPPPPLSPAVARTGVDAAPSAPGPTPRPRRYATRRTSSVEVATPPPPPWPRFRPLVAVLAAAVAGLAVVVVGGGVAVGVAVASSSGSLGAAPGGLTQAAPAPLAALGRWLASAPPPAPELAEVTTASGAMVEVAEGFGVVEIAVSADADVWIDGGSRGVVQQEGRFTLEAGDYEVVVRSGGVLHEDLVRVVDGQATVLDFRDGGEQG